MIYTLGQAAKATGKAKGTIKNAIDKGRLSASKDDLGQYQIDGAELSRVYNLNTDQDNSTPKLNDAAPPVDQAETLYLRQRITDLEAQIERERTNADEWREQAQRLALTGPDHGSSASPSSATETPRRGRFSGSWAALIGSK